MTTHGEAVQALEHAIKEVAELMAEDGEVVTDAVLILGVQSIGNDGSRDGRVLGFPRNGSQPPYITTGLVDSFHDRIMIEHAWDRWHV